MGSIVMNKIETYSRQEKKQLKSKGDRLGWKFLYEDVRTPLKDLSGKGEIVKDEYVFCGKVAKMAL